MGSLLLLPCLEKRRRRTLVAAHPLMALKWDRNWKEERDTKENVLWESGVIRRYNTAEWGE